MSDTAPVVEAAAPEEEAQPKSQIAAFIEESLAEPDAPTDAAEAVAEPPPAEPEPAKVEPVVEKTRVELAYAKAQRELKAHKAELEKLKAGGDGLEKLKASFAKNPLKALEEATGKPIKEIFEAARRGDYDIRDDLPEDVKEKLKWVEQLQAKEAEREKIAEAERAKAARVAERTNAIPRVKSLIESEASKYPFLSAVDTGAEHVIDEIYDRMDAGHEVDVPQVMAFINGRAQEVASFWLRQKDVISQIVKSDAKIRETLLAMLGTSGGQTSVAPTKVPAAVGTLTEVGGRVDPKRDITRDITSEIAEEWKRLRKG